MRANRRRRVYFILILLVALSSSLVLVLYALKNNINFFYGPAEVVSGEVQENVTFRLGGVVKEESVRYGDNMETVEFIVTDRKHEVRVSYQGILPDLFREGSSVVSQGKMNAHGVFVADEILAKHDSSYMPPEIAAMLELP